MEIRSTHVRSILTRTSGFLKTVTSHSLQPYAGCPLGHSLCGVGCYVQHFGHLLRGRTWGDFLDVRENAAEVYVEHYERERAWARRSRGEMSIFLSSSTEPFPPQEDRYGVTTRILETMLERPPDLLVLQTHSHRIASRRDLLLALQNACRLRVHLSIETDRERLPGLPPPGSSVDRRFDAAASLKAAGIPTVITVSPLLPIADPPRFFARIAESAHACVIDHFVGGDGSESGARTHRTPLPAAMATVEPASLTLAYRDAMLTVARQHLPGRIGVGIDGFAARYRPLEDPSPTGDRPPKPV